MKIEKITPANDYDGLKIQFNALRALYGSKLAEIEVYQKRIKEFSFERVIQLEAELESEKAMNDILTRELETFKSE